MTNYYVTSHLLSFCSSTESAMLASIWSPSSGTAGPADVPGDRRPRPSSSLLVLSISPASLRIPASARRDGPSDPSRALSSL